LTRRRSVEVCSRPEVEREVHDSGQPVVRLGGQHRSAPYPSACDHLVDESLQQMGWLQGAIWSNRHVMEAVMAQKAKTVGDVPDLEPRRGFMDIDR